MHLPFLHWKHCFNKEITIHTQCQFINVVIMITLFLFLSILLVVSQSIANESTTEDPCVSSFVTGVNNCKYQLKNDTSKYGEGGEARTCCIAAKFTHCVESQSRKGCEADPSVIFTRLVAMSEVDYILESRNCGIYGKYPSAACYLYFNKVYFAIGGLSFVALFAAIGIGKEIKRRRRLSIHD